MLTAPRVPDSSTLVATRYRIANGGKGSLVGGENSSASIKTSKFVTKALPAVGEAATMTTEKITTEVGDGSTSLRVPIDDRDDKTNFNAKEPPQATGDMSTSSGSSLSLMGRQEQGEETSMHDHFERRRSSSGSNRDNGASALTITRGESIRLPIASAEKRDGEGREVITAATALRREEAGGGRGEMEGGRVYLDPNRKEQLQLALRMAKQRTCAGREGSSSLGALGFHDGGEGGGRGGCESLDRSRGRGHGGSRLRHGYKVYFQEGERGFNTKPLFSCSALHMYR